MDFPKVIWPRDFVVAIALHTLKTNKYNDLSYDRNVNFDERVQQKCWEKMNKLKMAVNELISFQAKIQQNLASVDFCLFSLVAVKISSFTEISNKMFV